MIGTNNFMGKLRRLIEVYNYTVTNIINPLKAQGFDVVVCDSATKGR